MNFLAPPEITELAAGIGRNKAGVTVGRLLVLGILAGVYIGFGANLATVVCHDAPQYLGNGISQLLFGSVFSLGLMLVVIGGAELFTGNNMFMVVGALAGTNTWGDLVKNWTVVWIANFAGSLLLVYLLVGGFYGTGLDGAVSAGLFKGAVGVKALLIAKSKLELTWTSAFYRAILCNWLVCMAVWLALSSKDVSGKLFAIFFPIAAFVASGFEHSVANMFFIPMGLHLSHLPPVLDAAARTALTPAQLNLLAAGGTLPPDAIAAMEAFRVKVAAIFTWKNFLLNNLLPVTLGNIIGGSFFVGTLYWFAYWKKDTAPAAKESAEIGVGN
jgi:formate/nitrite transporter